MRCMHMSKKFVVGADGSQSYVDTTPEDDAQAAIDQAAWEATQTLPRPSHLNFGGLVRFAGTAPVSVYENIRLGAVTRVSKGRWRTNLVEAIPDGFSPIVSYIDAAVRNVRVSAITANYVEVKAVDAAGVAADCQQVIVKIERVIS